MSPDLDGKLCLDDLQHLLIANKKQRKAIEAQHAIQGGAHAAQGAQTARKRTYSCMSERTALHLLVNKA